MNDISHFPLCDLCVKAKLTLFSIDESNTEQQEDTCFVGQRSGRVIRPLGSGKFGLNSLKHFNLLRFKLPDNYA